MPPNPRVAKAFRAMKVMGISEDKVKPVLKDLLKLYEKNWELIEEESYRALADAIFEREEAEAAGPSRKTVNDETAGPSKKIVNNEIAGRSKKIVNNEQEEEEALANEEAVRPLKRLRLRYQEGQPSSHTNSNASLPVTPLIIPKEEKDELSKISSIYQVPTMAKLTPLMFCFVALLALTTAFAYTTTTTITVVEEENKGMGCKRQFEQQQKLYHCKMYLTQQSQSEKNSLRSFNTRQSTEEHLNDCCRQLEKISEGCRCRNLERVVQQQQQLEGSYLAQEMGEIVQKAKNLPGKCNLEPKECQMRALIF